MLVIGSVAGTVVVVAVVVAQYRDVGVYGQVDESHFVKMLGRPNQLHFHSQITDDPQHKKCSSLFEHNTLSPSSHAMPLPLPNQYLESIFTRST